MKYIDFEYYANSYGGYIITSEKMFDHLALKARAFVNKITFGRITSPTDDVKNAICAVCDELFFCAGQGGISSENNDGYSVSYADHSHTAAVLYAAAVIFLPPELMYCGM